MKSDGGFLKFIYQGTRGENRFLGLPAKGHYKIEDASLHAAHTSTKMHFSSSLLSSSILVLGYLTNTALSVPTNEPSKESKLAVNNNQQPFQSTGNCKRTAFPNRHVQWTDLLLYKPLPLLYLSTICSYRGCEKDWILTSTMAL